MTEEKRCFMCARMPVVKDNDWSLDSLTFIFEKPDDLCQKHKEFCNQRIAELTYEESLKPPSPQILEVVKPFLKITPPNPKNYINFSEPKSVREPGQEG